MNIQKLFEIQAGLDAHIEEEHPKQEGEDRLAKKILALQVELGELANEWRGFKFWSQDQDPRTEASDADIVSNSDYVSIWNPLLEEYVDCLHFILSIGLELGIKPEDICIGDDLTGETTTETFNQLFSYVSALEVYLDIYLPAAITGEDIKESYQDIFECFVGLGELHLGFTWEEVETAYLEKNKINHERQNDGY